MPIPRHTSTRQAVLRAVKFASAPITAGEIRTRLGKVVGRAESTVFRNLNHLVRNGEIAVIDSSDGQTRYIGHAYHETTFRCVRCKKVQQVSSQSVPTYVDKKMFGRESIVTSQLIAQGLCESCLTKMQRHV